MPFRRARNKARRQANGAKHRLPFTKTFRLVPETVRPRVIGQLLSIQRFQKRRAKLRTCYTFLSPMKPRVRGTAERARIGNLIPHTVSQAVPCESHTCRLRKKQRPLSNRVLLPNLRKFDINGSHLTAILSMSDLSTDLFHPRFQALF